MSRSSFLLPDALADYYAQVGYREPEALATLRRETAAMPMARMQIAPEQGQFLALLARLCGARRAIEVGVFTGYSSLAVADAMGPDGHLLACDISEEWTAVARRHWQSAGVEARIELRLAPALDTLDEEIRADAPAYDMAFIDADKTNYAGYYERCLQLLRPGGLIAVDNVLWGGRVADPDETEPDTAALRAFNEAVAADDRVQHCLVPIADGVTVCIKR